jgi:signal transduction histidine kinase
MRLALVAALSTLGIAAGIYSLAVARDDPAFWFAGASARGAVALLGAGWLLIGCGLAFWARRRAGGFGPLLAAAGFAWLLLEWNNPGIGSPLAFTAGLCLYASCPPLVAHAVFAHRARAAIVVGYVANVLLLGVLPALFFDGPSQGCAQCPANLVLVADRGDVVNRLYRIGVDLGFLWSATLAVLAFVTLVRGTGAARRAAWPLLVPGGVYLALVAAWLADSRARGFLGHDTLDRRLWLAQAVALAGVALGAGWGALRAHRARTAVARLVVELAHSPPPGGLRTVLAQIVGDPDLVLAYPLEGAGRLVDAQGRPVELSAGTTQTVLVRDGSPVAVLAHARGLLDDEQLVDDVTTASRLALENERLQAEVRARLEQLRSSRARIVAAGDAERRRLERDLHDGAQQRLVALSLSLRLLRSRLATDADGVRRLDAAAAELDRATAELRELAHGIFPAVLADGGLAVAVRALAEDGPVPIRIGRLPDARFPSAVETAAYTVIAEAATTATSSVGVDAECRGTVLHVEVETDDTSLDLGALQDRLGALEGRLGVERGAGGRVTIRAEVPCGS